MALDVVIWIKSLKKVNSRFFSRKQKKSKIYQNGE